MTKELGELRHPDGTVEHISPEDMKARLLEAARFPKDVPNVQAGLEALSQRECLVTADELMSRRGHNHRDLSYLIAVLRRERVAWRDARDAKEAKREEAEEDV